MARSCGLRIGPRRFELVVLDGSGKKHKVVSHYAGDLGRPTPDQDEDPLTLAAHSIREIVKQQAVPKENVGLAIDSGQAAFRMLKMPFADKAKIESVIKFEVESLLPQWNIDDVIVDFHVLESTEEASELLVTAVQKSDLQRAIGIAESAGLEPLQAELETTAMVNAALASNLCSVDDARILVHVGEHSTSVVVVDGGKAREMRAIHIGALSHEIVQPVDKEGDDAEKGDKKEEAPATGTWLDAPPDADELERRLEQTIKRIRRELGRTVSATRTVHPIQSILVCGLDVPGLVGSQILDLPVQRFELAVEGAPGGAESAGLVVAYGVALRQLGGGVLQPELRREELRYTGAFERVELPLAVVCLLLLTLLGVWNIFLQKETNVVDAKLGIWRNRSIEYLMGNPKAGQAGVLRSPSDKVKRFVAGIDEELDLELTRVEQINQLKATIEEEIRKYEKDLGVDTEIAQPQSALAASVLVLDVLEDVANDKLRPSLRKLKASYQNGKAQKNDRVKVSLDYSVFADSQLLATQMHEQFIEELNKKPWIETRVEARAADPIDNGKGVYVENQIIEVNLSKAPKAEPVRQPQ
jgi:Tfp pilus assembly PilM family ATPase